MATSPPASNGGCAAVTSSSALSDFSEYWAHIQSDPDEVPALLNAVLINVTDFFRDPQAWEYLRSDVLPRSFAELRPSHGFRAWSAGCSNGAEPYSLAISLAEQLGPRLTDFNIKIYATDMDEEALSAARLGTYGARALRRLSRGLREAYFTNLGNGQYRISREIRRLVIFGRSNLITQAPISHCNIVLCRNLLIYLDQDTQRQILRKFHYALNPLGILFLGKSESRLNESTLFRPLHPRWRIFQKLDTRTPRPKDEPTMNTTENVSQPDGSLETKAQQELRTLRLQQQYLLESLGPGVLILDANHVVSGGNENIQSVFGVPLSGLRGRRLQSTDLAQVCPAVLHQLNQGQGTERFECRIVVNGEEKFLGITIRPILTEDGARTGTLLYVEDQTPHKRLQRAVQQLEETSEELQSANEELETANEELQSTNEELETTNEELQSTNEELETTNEELQSVNEELENMNDELESRTGELNALAERYAQTLHRMPWPIMLVDKEERVQIWNSAAQEMLGFPGDSAVGIKLDQLPILPTALSSLLRRSRLAVVNQKRYILHAKSVSSTEHPQLYDIHFTPIMQGGNRPEGVLIMFGPAKADETARKASLKLVDNKRYN